MTTFPAIKPNGRSLSLGDTPQSVFAGPSGVGVRFQFGQKRATQRLGLSYVSLSESQINLFYTHYEFQLGVLLSFELPAVVWDGYTTIPVDPLEYNWRYATTFQVEAVNVNRFSLSVELESVII
jgi:hypothetical protein